MSAKYKGAFCEAKVSKVVRVVKCKITYKGGLGTSTVTDEHIRGPLRIGHTVQVLFDGFCSSASSNCIIDFRCVTLIRKNMLKPP